jgi:hypothetical protein
VPFKVAGRSDRPWEINLQRVPIHRVSSDGRGTTAFDLLTFLPYKHFWLRFVDPTGRGKREGPDFLLGNSVHGHVCGFL